jgi:hypothetical protein
MNADAYIRSLEACLAPHFAPGEIYCGRDGAMRLAREVGYGLRDLEGADNIVQSLYSRLLVRFTFSSGSVPADAKEWFAEIRKAMADD